jgi:SAM-dependent methyltransferase
MKLNLGAGSMPQPEYVNVDLVQLPGIDVVHDLNTVPWPWADDTAEEINAIDVFEHVDDPLAFMGEVWRVLKPGSEIYIHTSYIHEPGSFTDPTHKRFCTFETFDYWVPGTYLNQRYGPAYARGRHFEKVKIWTDGNPGYLNIILRKVG